MKHKNFNIDVMLDSLKGLISKHSLGFQYSNIHNLQLAKRLVVEGKENKDIWLAKHACFGSSLIVSKLTWENTDEKNAPKGEAYNLDERYLERMVAIKDHNFPNYYAHFLIPDKLAIGEGPRVVFRQYNRSNYDNRQRLLDSIVGNDFARIIAVGPETEINILGKKEDKFAILFNNPKEITVGVYTISSQLLKTTSNINTYLIVVKNGETAKKILVNHLYTILDNATYPIENIEIVDFFYDLAQWLNQPNNKVFIHCAFGLGRSGVLAAVIYLMLNKKILKNKNERQIAKLIHQIWTKFSMIRPGTICNESQLLNVASLFYKLNFSQ